MFFPDQAKVAQIVEQIEADTVTPETLSLHPKYRAILAALAMKLSNHEASKRMKVAETTCSDARFVRRNGTAQQWQDLIDLKASGSTIAKNIRNPDRMKILQEKSAAKLALGVELWDKLKGVFDAIQNLPRAADMVAIVNSNSIRRNTVETKLPIITSYIREFENAWNATHAKNPAYTANSGNGCQAPGAEPHQSASERPACRAHQEANPNGKMEI